MARWLMTVPGIGPFFVTALVALSFPNWILRQHLNSLILVKIGKGKM
ncbi:hypothetical protein [Ruegeria atlantica]|nr:hypothetical protein [Ruegeria atlantica]